MPLSSHRGRQIAALLGWVLAIATFIGVVNTVRASKVEVRNEGTEPVTDLVVRYEGGEARFDALAPGERASVRACPRHAGVAEVTWTAAGAQKSGKAGYLECGVFCLELDLQAGMVSQSTSCD